MIRSIEMKFSTFGGDVSMHCGQRGHLDTPEMLRLEIEVVLEPIKCLVHRCVRDPKGGQVLGVERCE